MNKLEVLASNLALQATGEGKTSQSTNNYKRGVIEGFRQAFGIINEELQQELKKLEEFPFMGERIMSMKIYQKKVSEVLVLMEKEYE